MDPDDHCIWDCCFACFCGVLVLTLIFAISIIWSCLVPVPAPFIQVDSVSISFVGTNVAQWNISFSVTNTDVFTVRYRKIEVSVGGWQALSTTTASIAPLSVHGLLSVKSRKATVYVALPSPRPPFIIVDGSQFNIWFVLEYESMIWKKKKRTTKAVCGDYYGMRCH